MTLSPSTMDEVAAFLSDAKRARLTSGKTMAIFALREDDVLVGMTGIVWFRGHGKFKNHYVTPAARGRRLFRYMRDVSIALARGRECAYVEATCTPMSIREYLRRGAMPGRSYKAGWVAVRLNLGGLNGKGRWTRFAR